MTQNHTLGQAEVEGLHPYQPGDVGLGMEQQRIKEVQEVLSGFIWRGREKRWAVLLAKVAWLSEEAQKATALFTLGFRGKLF